MPRKPKGKELRLNRKQISAITAGKIARKSQAEIAAAAGVSRSTVSHTPAPVKAMLQEFAERERKNLMAASAEMIVQLRKDANDPKNTYSERADAAKRLVQLMALGDQTTGLAKTSEQPGLEGVLAPVPMPDLLRQFYRQTDRVILERETTQVNGHVNGNGKMQE